MAQEFDNNNNYNNHDNNYQDNDMYSKYPTKENKYKCQKGPFESFFVSSVEFCIKDKRDDDKKDFPRSHDQKRTAS